MKKTLTPINTMENLTKYITEAYSASNKKTEGSIQFLLKHEGTEINCFLQVNKEEMTFSEGMIKNPTVTLQSTLYNWLDLAAKRLNPIVGVMTGKLKFKGDISFFSKAIPEELFDTDISGFADPITEFEKNPTKNWQKPLKILVINASPRGKHGYTDFYLKPFVEGLESAGSEVEIIHIHKMNIETCTGCWHCWLSGTNKCIKKDDVEGIHEKQQQADMIVYAFPLYSMGMPSILKNLMDRGVELILPYMIEGPGMTRHPRRSVKKQSTVLFSICGFDDISHFNPLRATVKERSYHNHTPIVAEILRPACMYLYSNPLEYKTLNTVLTALKQAGEELATNGKVERKTNNKISQKVSEKDFKDSANAFWLSSIKEGKKTY